MGSWNVIPLIQRSVFLVIIGLFFTFSATSQTFKDYQKAAEKAFIQKDHYTALMYYLEAAEIEPNRPEVWDRIACSAYELNAYGLADTAFLKVMNCPNPETYYKATYLAGMVKKNLGKYSEAIDLFEKYKAAYADKDPELLLKVERELANAKYALEWTAEPSVDYIVERLEGDVNTPNSEYSPFLKGDTLYYASLNFPREDKNFEGPERPYSKVLLAKEGNQPDLLKGVNDSLLHTGHLVFAPAGNRIYYTVCDFSKAVDVQCKIYTRTVDAAGNYGSPVALPATVNAPGFTSTEPSVGRHSIDNQDVLYFASTQPNGKGKLDIWYAVLDASGMPTEVKNLEAINTTEDDATPFFHNLTQTLYFASTGRPNIGGFDIYKTELVTNQFGQVQHMPIPVNSSYNDTYYFLDEYGTQGYLSSNRPGANYLENEIEACCYDLYSIDLQKFILDLTTFNARTKEELIGTTVSLYEVDENGKEILVERVINGEGANYKFPVMLGKKYKIVAEKNGFVTTTDELDLTGDTKGMASVIKKSLYLPPNDIRLEVLTFDADTKEPLLGVTVQLIEMDEVLATDDHDNDNKFNFNIERNKKYKIIAFKPGFHGDSLVIDLVELGNPTDLIRKLYLKEKDIREFPPMYLFFDNDQPDPKTVRNTTTKTYDQTFDPYYSKMPEFITKYTEVLAGRDKFLAEQRMKAFFEREVRNSYESLDVFAKKLLEFSEKGQVIEVTIKGYTSPRASEAYNAALSNRRISSLQNYFTSYANGALVPFLKSGQLRIVEVPFGEANAPKDVSDKLKDERNSIFSVAASMERRVEIIGIRLQ